MRFDWNAPYLQPPCSRCTQALVFGMRPLRLQGLRRERRCCGSPRKAILAAVTSTCAASSRHP